MKASIVFVAALLCQWAIGQERASGRVAELIAQLEEKHTPFKRVEPFVAEPVQVVRDHAVSAMVEHASLFQVHIPTLLDVIKERPSNVVLVIPATGGAVDLLLTRVHIFSDDFSMTVASSDRAIAHAPGLHYQGVIDGDPNTLAAISIFEDEVMGFVSDQRGNHVLGKFGDGSGEHVYYAERDMFDVPVISCETPEDDGSYAPDDLVLQEGARSLKCVDLYWEVDHDVFQHKGGINATSNYITGLFNLHAVLFANDGVSVRLSQLFIWDIPSPYTAVNASGLLTQFRVYRTSFNGDLAHLIGYGCGGGVASGLAGLCNAVPSSSMCYSGVSWSYQPLPTYSWSIMVVTHEEGHLMGSRHTHACAWNGNNTAIDGCYNTEGSCQQGPMPPNGGTIMSYCHIWADTGINFSNGFGPQPTAVILNNVNMAPCLNSCAGCGDPHGLMSLDVFGTGATLVWSAVAGADTYDLEWKPSMSSTWNAITAIADTSLLLTGLVAGTSYEFRVGSVCLGGSSAFSASITFSTPTCQPGTPCDDGNPNTGPDHWNYTCNCVGPPVTPMVVDKVVALDRSSTDNFGISVAISGDHAIVGAWFTDGNAVGGSPVNNAGAAYIFHWNGAEWVQQQKIVASDRTTHDEFGVGVAIDGDYAVVGAKNDGHGVGWGGTTVMMAGSAYIFKRTDGVWVEQQKIVASDRNPGDQFGNFVAISGEYVIVSAHGNNLDEQGGNVITNAGAAYIFKRTGSTWAQQAKLVASDRGGSDSFGVGVSISGAHAIVGTLGEDEDENGDNTLLNAGSAYIFQRNGDVWDQQQKLVASDRTPGAYFGWSCAIDGDHAIVGAIYDARDENGGGSTYNAGSAYIFKNTGGQWIQQQKIVPADRQVSAWFGRSVSISGDRALVGAINDRHDILGNDPLESAGAAYMFERNGTSWSQMGKIVAGDREEGDRFGYSVSIDGGRAIVGALDEDHDTYGMNPMSNSGSAYLISDPLQVGVAARVMLSGPYAAPLMTDVLRVLGVIPGTEPYSAMGFAQAGGGGGETVQPSVFGTSGVNAIVDWVLVELRGGAPLYPILATRSALLQRDGDVVGSDGNSAVFFTIEPGEYHIAIRHRNHLGVMTESPIALTSGATMVDFTNPATATFGTSAQKNVNGTMLLWPADVNHDGQVKYTGNDNDRDLMLQAIGGAIPTDIVYGYYDADVNLDGQVKYTGTANDRDVILQTIGGAVPTAVRVEQMP